jgi:hypothetical protein
MPMKDQALAGGIFNTVAQVGRATGLAVATAIDIAMRHSDGNALGAVKEGHRGTRAHKEYVLLSSLRSTQWANFALAIIAICLVVSGLRKIGRVGAARQN